MTANLLPIPKLQFFNENGAPLASGKVYTYIPATTTLKDTWQDAGQTTLNTNPIILNARGECLLYGSGQYRLIVQDSLGNEIYDQLTRDYNPDLATLASPSFTGTPTAPNATTGTDTTQIATTHFVQQELTAYPGQKKRSLYAPTTTSYSVADTDDAKVISSISAGGALTCSLPAISGLTSGFSISFIRLTNNINVTVSGADRIAALGNASLSSLVLSAEGEAVTIWTDGTKWYAAGSAGISYVKSQTITASGTYTAPTNLVYAIVTAVGGGGGGGGASAAGSQGAGSAGGGAGGYARSILSAATIGASQSVTIGAGGAGGSGSAAGANGGQTSFGSILYATGGAGGNFNTASASSVTFATAGDGGNGGGGSVVNSYGQAGTNGFGISLPGSAGYYGVGGNGGASHFGGGGKAGINSGNGSSGGSYGAGGGGAAAVATNSTGGNGASGVVIVEEFCFV